MLPCIPISPLDRHFSSVTNSGMVPLTTVVFAQFCPGVLEVTTNFSTLLMNSTLLMKLANGLLSLVGQNLARSS